MSKVTSGISRRTMFKAAGMVTAVALVGLEGQASAQEGLVGRDVLKDKRPVIHPGGPKLGVYDPYGDFRDEAGVSTEHLFLPWEDVELAGLDAADEYAQERGRKILITVEPWSWDLSWNVSTEELRNRILAGYYDENMRAICSAVAGFKSPITIRWAHEMENPFGRFTWSLWPAADYIKAFQKMHAIIKGILPDAKVMWSPRGEKTLQDYYPGDEFVDTIGLSVFGLDEFDKIEYGAPRTFAESLKQGYDLSVGFGKPIWVAELAYEGDLDYLTKWVQDSTFNHAEFPALEEVVYFNDREVWPWPYGLGLPQWRVIRDAPAYPQRPSRG